MALTMMHRNGAKAKPKAKATRAVVGRIDERALWKNEVALGKKELAVERKLVRGLKDIILELVKGIPGVNQRDVMGVVEVLREHHDAAGYCIDEHGARFGRYGEHQESEDCLADLHVHELDMLRELIDDAREGARPRPKRTARSSSGTPRRV